MSMSCFGLWTRIGCPTSCISGRALPRRPSTGTWGVLARSGRRTTGIG
jgi:hypothetical protein